MTALLSRHIVIIYILSTCYGVSHGNEGCFFTGCITALFLLPLPFVYFSLRPIAVHVFLFFIIFHPFLLIFVYFTYIIFKNVNLSKENKNIFVFNKI